MPSACPTAPLVHPERHDARSPTRPSRARFASYSPTASAPHRVESIDGLRALGLLLVFFNHASGTQGMPEWLARLTHDPHLGLAGHGVKFFFVISGFLITSILMRELDRSGTIDIVAFVRRRARRILPGLLAFLLVVGALRLAGLFEFDWRQFVSALTLSGPTGTWELGHLWSMAVQEQFFVAWALLLIVCGRRAASHCAVGVLIVVPTARVVHATLQPDATSIYLTYGASIDTLALGCLLALHRERLASHRWFDGVVESRYWIPLLYMVGAASAIIGWRPSLLVRTPLVAAAIALLLERCIRHPDTGLARLLRARGLVYLGTASYSLYLWQQLFLRPGATAWPTTFPVNVLAALGVGLLFWYLVERPSATGRSGVPLGDAPSSGMRRFPASWHRSVRSLVIPRGRVRPATAA